MAVVNEYKCGCMVHSLAGTIRKCDGTTSRTTSGKMAPKPEGAEMRHNRAMESSAVRSYDVAEILP
jgi:hypothetical protein